jgi:hypothetical protein
MKHTKIDKQEDNKKGEFGVNAEFALSLLLLKFKPAKSSQNR